MIKSFSNLLNETQDLETLEHIQKLVNDRIDVVSNSSSHPGTMQGSEKPVVTEEETPMAGEESVITNVKNPSDGLEHLVTLREDYPLPNSLEASLHEELRSLFNVLGTARNVKYQWLNSTSGSYSFGGRTLLAKRISAYNSINSLMDILNKDLDCNLNSCRLISCYKSVDTTTPRHSDNEMTIDHKHVICNFSLGSTREFQFFKGRNSDKPLVSHVLQNRSLMLMLPGCQQKLLHEIPKGLATDADEYHLRFCLSFRKTSPSKPAIPLKVKPFPLSAKPHTLTGHNSNIHTEFTGMHPSRLSTLLKSDQDDMTTVPIKHVIVGDSLTRDINLPGTVTITKGGCRITDILTMLKNDKMLSKDQYKDTETVILCVGTNSISKLDIPLVTILNDYDNLISEFTKLFPMARIGLFNIPPRKYLNFNHVVRLKSFNNCFLILKFHMPMHNS